MFRIFYPLQLASSFRGWGQLAGRAAWGAPCWSLTWCCWWLWDLWWEPRLHRATGSQLVPEAPCYFALQRQMTLLHTGPCLCCQLSRALLFPLWGWPCPWRTSKLQFKGSEAATGPTAAPLKRLPACIAPKHTILPSTPWENILTQAFIGDHSSLPIY